MLLELVRELFVAGDERKLAVFVQGENAIRDDLDVEELERRLELAPTVGAAPGDCTVQNSCTSQCNANVWWVCSG